MQELKLLLLEDDPLDAELNITALEAGGYECEWERVQMKDEFIAALKKPDYDLILIDYNLPAFDGMSALHILRDSGLDIPAILVSGNLGEELAIDSMRAGAVDYVHKDRINRLVPSVKRALEENKLRRTERAQANDLALFNTLNQAANSGASWQEIIDLLVVETQRNFPSFASHFYMLSKDGQYLEMQKQAMPLKIISKLEKTINIPLPLLRLPATEDTLYGKALATEETIWFKDAKSIEELYKDFLAGSSLSKESITRLEKLIPSIYKLLGIKEALTAPLIIGNKAIGVLAVSRRGEFFPEDIGRIEVLAGQVAAILSRKLAEEEIKKIQYQQELILNSAGEGIFGLDIEGRHTFVNPAAAQMLGYSFEEMLGKNSHILLHHTNSDGSSCREEKCPVYRTYHNGESTYQGHAEFWRKDGSSFPILYSSNAIEEDGKRVGAVVTFRDISEQVEATREIARLAQVVEQASVTVAITDLDGDLVYVNPYFEKSSGYSVDEALGNNPRMLKSGHQDNAAYEELWETIAKGKTWHNMLVNKRKDGSLYYEDTNIFPIKTEEGEIINYAAVKREITAEVEANKALKEEKDFSERVINTSNALIIGLDKDHLIRIFNKGAEITTGYKKDDVLGKDWFLLAFRSDVKEEMNDVWETSWGTISHTYINPIWTKSGEKRIVSWQSTGFYEDLDEEKQLLLSIGEDITERKESEEQIRLQNSRLEALFSIDREILSNTDIKATLDVVLAQVKKGLRVDAANILVFDPSIQSLERKVLFGFNADQSDYKRLRLGKGLAGKTALERKTTFIQNLNKEDNLFAQTPSLLSENFNSYFGLPLLAQGKLKGVLEIFHRSTLDPNAEWLKFLDMLAGQAAIAIDRISLVENLEKNNTELRLAYDTTLEGWARALELRDMETIGHSRRVTDLTVELSIAMGIDRRLMDHIRRGALLHDIGKMGVPDAILNKPSPLTDIEWTVMKQHPVMGYEMLKEIVYLKPALDIPYSHHERWDGSGYPIGMHGEAIPLSARVFAVVDVYDALTNNRPYRKAWSKTETLARIKEQSGKHFDPQVVEVFIKMMEEKDDGD